MTITLNSHPVLSFQTYGPVLFLKRTSLDRETTPSIWQISTVQGLPSFSPPLVQPGEWRSASLIQSRNVSSAPWEAEYLQADNDLSRDLIPPSNFRGWNIYEKCKSSQPPQAVLNFVVCRWERREMLILYRYCNLSFKKNAVVSASVHHIFGKSKLGNLVLVST